MKNQHSFANKTLLITGGTGSFGHAVLKRFLKTAVREIRIFSRDEKKQEDMRIAFNDPKLKFYLGNIKNYESLYQAMRSVDYVFHAAALKQVPSCEFYPLEAVKTNILGTENVMNAAISHKVKRVVLLSTDKAVYPINAMGLSKAMMEKLMIAKARMCGADETIFCATRYGNVMASRGSVIPLFIKQIQANKPITITDPNMTRFLMTLEESVALVMHAFAHAKQGDIFVQKAPASTIKILAESLKQLLNSQSDITVIGTRHGEKLFETLVSREELAHAETIGNYYRIPADNRDLNYAKYFIEGEMKVANYDDYTSHNTQQLNIKEVKALLSQLEIVQTALHNKAELHHA